MAWNLRGFSSFFFAPSLTTHTPQYSQAEEKRDSSLRKPTVSQERTGKKKRRLAPFGMTLRPR
jgi:hypothetical protein